MINIIYAPSFLRRYKKLHSELQMEVKEKIGQFQIEANHTKLKVHKLGGLDNTWAFSVNYKIRIIFEYGANKNQAHLLLVGSHDDVY
jgi:mRNA-degrading endonuclease RelE of RelBE toxin-antitoxin system